MATPSVALAERSPTQTLMAQVRSPQFKEQVSLALPSNVRPERFVRATLTAIAQNPEVATHPESLFNAALKAAQDGLLPDGREAAFVMFKQDGVKKVVYLPMLGGFRKIAAQHGITLVADVVHAGDGFAWRKVPPALEHTPELDDAKRGEVICAYAAAFDSDWNFVTAPVVMNVTEIEKVRAVSRASKSGPWVDWWERMAVKTVARRLFHELPLGDLDEGEARIVEQADVDVDLPAASLTADEADVAARLSGALPPEDAGPDDRVPPAEPDAGTGEAGAPDTPERQHGLGAELRFEEQLERLNKLDPDTDWIGAAVKTYGKPAIAFTDAELEASTKEMRQVADTLEESKTK